MRKINKLLKTMLFTGLLSVTLISCEDIIEEDITDDNITVQSPLDGSVIASNSVMFQWNSLGGAEDYRIQIIDDSNVIILDSLIMSTSFNYPMNPGDYSWRVRGENFAYQTAYSFSNYFNVVSSDDLSSQSIFLITPTNNIYVNYSTGILTTWTGITTADSYTFELEQDVSGSITTLYQEIGLTSTSHTIDSNFLTTDAVYTWKVKALNVITSTETLFSSRTISLDTQVPNIPTLSLPIDNATMTGLINFTWNTGLDTGLVQSPVTSTLEIASDVAFTTIVQAYQIGGNSQSHDFAVVGDYYWRVKNIDQATNESFF